MNYSASPLWPSVGLFLKSSTTFICFQRPSRCFSTNWLLGFWVFWCICMWERIVWHTDILIQKLQELLLPSVYEISRFMCIFGVMSDCSIPSNKTIFVVLIWSHWGLIYNCSLTSLDSKFTHLFRLTNTTIKCFYKKNTIWEQLWALWGSCLKPRVRSLFFESQILGHIVQMSLHPAESLNNATMLQIC